MLPRHLSAVAATLTLTLAPAATAPVHAHPSPVVTVADAAAAQNGQDTEKSESRQEAGARDTGRLLLGMIAVMGLTVIVFNTGRKWGQRRP